LNRRTLGNIPWDAALANLLAPSPGKGHLEARLKSVVICRKGIFMKAKHFLGCVRVAAAKALRRRLTLLSVTAVAAGTISAGSATNYNAFVAQGYRRVMVDGPYGCPSKTDLRQITHYGTENTELKMVEQLRAFENGRV
jgi:hypothetical protein